MQFTRSIRATGWPTALHHPNARFCTLDTAYRNLRKEGYFSERKSFGINGLIHPNQCLSLFIKCERVDCFRLRKKFNNEIEKTLDYDRVFSYFPFSPKSHVPMGVRRTLELVRKSVRYLELTPPVAIPANRKMRGHLKQRRCGPFCSLPAFHQRGLLKRHTFIAGSAVGFSLQSMADKAEQSSWRGVVHHPRIVRMSGPGVSTGWYQDVFAYALCPPAFRSLTDWGIP